MAGNATIDAMRNATGNATNGTSAALVERAGDAAVVVRDFVPLVFMRMWDLVAAPLRHQQMLWIIFPLLLTFLVLEFYFERHGDEELGWAAAVANSLILFIIAIDLVRHSFHGATPFEVLRTLALAAFTEAVLPFPPQVLVLIAFLGLAGVAVTLINYFHLLPRRLAFEVSGHPPVNFLAYFAIAIVYSAEGDHPIPLDVPTLVAGALLYVLILIAVFSAKRMVSRAVGRSGGGYGRR